MPIRACWISGSMHERKLALDKIKSQFSGADVQTYDGVFTLAYLEQRVFSPSCFHDTRLIIIREMPVSNSTRPTLLNNLKKLLGSVPADCYVVFDGLDLEKEKPIADYIIKANGPQMISPLVFKRNEAIDFVMETFAASEKTISADDAELMIDTCGYDQYNGGIGVDQLRISVNKVSLAIGKRKKTVEKNDISDNVLPTQEFIIWKIYDALDSKSYDKCQEVWEHFQANGGTPEGVFHLCLPRYRMLCFLKEAVARGLSKTDAAKEISTLYKIAQTGTGFQATLEYDLNDTGESKGQPKQAYTAFAVEPALFGKFGRKPIIDLYSRKELFRILTCLEECFGAIRQLDEAGQKLLVDVFLMAVCTQVDDLTLKKLRRFEC